MKTTQTLLFLIGLSLLPFAARAETISFPAVGKNYKFIYSNPEQSPISPKQIPKQSRGHYGEVYILENAGNGWIKAEYTIPIWDLESKELVDRKVRNWLNMAMVSMAIELQDDINTK